MEATIKYMHNTFRLKAKPDSPHKVLNHVHTPTTHYLLQHTTLHLPPDRQPVINNPCRVKLIDLIRPVCL
ncbi:hypothetical protein DES35_101134 [Schleiferia thermophila]|uniref:Uncharacterized protein n=1 Tax=Schleiferia thermophila TaxID=884107 RepID=A0A369ABR8_9FLAO|nr:hypothetical protein DES35_101134 [Schleiferia thermophila]